MKRTAAQITAVILFSALCLTACGRGQTDNNNSVSSSADNTAAETGAAETAAGVDASADPTVILSYGGTAAAEDLTTQAMERLAKLAEERSGGTIKINVFPASQLGDAVAQMESMIAGGQDMFTEAHLTYMFTYGSEECGIEPGGLFNTKERLEKWIDSDIFAGYMEDFRKKNGVATLAHNYYRLPIIVASKKPLNSLEDFKGVKLRTVPNPTTSACFEALGFSTTSVAYGEVYLSLQQGVIDATITPFDAAYSMGFYEVAPYLHTFYPIYTNMAVWINDSKFQNMTKAQQQILIEASKEAGDWYTEQIEQQKSEIVSKMEQGRAEFVEPTQELKDGAAEIAGKVIMDMESAGTLPSGVYKKAKDYLDAN